MTLRIGPPRARSRRTWRRWAPRCSQSAPARRRRGSASDWGWRPDSCATEGLAPQGRSAPGPTPTYTRRPMAEDVISFARGAPSADLLPADAVREAAERALTDDWKRALSYGTGIGHPELCAWIADQHALDPSQVMVTNGSLEAGAMLFEHLVAPSDRVVVEQPSYDRTLLLLERIGAERVGVPLEADGIDVDALDSALGAAPAKLVHLIPNFHNPAGCTLSDEKRRRVVEIAARHDCWIFEDDPYGEVGFEGERLATLLSLDGAGRVIHASSFSKTVSPGVRIGYLAGPADEIKALAKRANEIYISPHARRVDRPRAVPLRRAGAQHRAGERGAQAAPRRARRRPARARPRGRLRDPRRGLLPLADARRRRRLHRAARGRRAGARGLHPRSRLHARGRRVEPAAVVCEHSPRSDSRGRAAARARPGAGSLRHAGVKPRES